MVYDKQLIMKSSVIILSVVKNLILTLLPSLTFYLRQPYVLQVLSMELPCVTAKLQFHINLLSWA